MGVDAARLARYERIAEQLKRLFEVTQDPISRMATISAVLYHKFNKFFWCGFYRLVDGQLLVGPYQGFLACQKLKKDSGVCWASANSGETVIVPDVEKFPGHIACDSRSKSEIVVPVFDSAGRVCAVLDIDSDRLDSFDETDARGLEQIVGLLIA